MKYKMIVGNNPNGIFYVDTKSKKILNVEIFDLDSFKTNFPLVLEGYNYLLLEQIMQHYTKKDLSLLAILKNIEQHGFFNLVKPGLRIYVEKYK